MNNARRAPNSSVLHERLGIILEAFNEINKVEALIRTPKCLSFRQLEDYIKGVYTGEALERIFDHTTSCPYCRKMATEMRRAIEERIS